MKGKLSNRDVTSLNINGIQYDVDKNGNFDLPEDCGKELAEQGLSFAADQKSKADDNGKV